MKIEKPMTTEDGKKMNEYINLLKLKKNEYIIAEKKVSDLYKINDGDGFQNESFSIGTEFYKHLQMEKQLSTELQNLENDFKIFMEQFKLTFN